MNLSDFANGDRFSAAIFCLTALNSGLIKLIAFALGRALIAFVLTASLIAPARAEFQFLLKGGLGAEYDSNALRVTKSEDDKAAGDFLLRLNALASFRWLSQQRHHQIYIDYDGGGKKFFNETTEDNLINSGNIRYFVRPLKYMGAGAKFWIKDSILRVSDRDYTTLSGSLSLSVYPFSGGSLTFNGGMKYFRYKPDDDYTNYSPFVGLAYVQQFIDYLSGSLEGEYTRRKYKGSAYVIVPSRYEGQTLIREIGGRDDDLGTGRLSIVYSGVVLASLTYMFQYNSSNSVGESFYRNRVGVDLTAVLPWEILLHWQGALQFTHFLDGLSLGQRFFMEEDDENQTSMVFRVSRPVYRDILHIELRYALYANEFSGQSLPFFRQTVSAGLSVKFSDVIED